MTYLYGGKISDEVCISILNWLWEKDETLLSDEPLLSQQALARLSGELNGRHIVAFVVDYELRQNSQYAQHLCFKVRFINQELRPFSVDKAVTALIKAEAGHATTNEAGEHSGLNG